MDELPFDSHVPEALRSLEERTSLVVEAPPGAGKTTRLPWALTRAPWCTGQVLVTEPRRIAARMAATRVAQERELSLGQEVGYRVRFEERTSAHTQLIYLTEGVLLRQLLQDPELRQVSAVVFDEVHEQSAELEVALALTTRLQRKRPQLRLIAMSATLDGARFAEYWEGAPRLQSHGRSYEVQTSFLPRPDERPLEIQVRSAVRQIQEEARDADTPGDVLVFLPGAREIRQAQEALGALPSWETVALHGDLPFEEQTRVLRPSSPQARVILSTNLAESSLTIPRVTTVIDSGWARVAQHDPWTSVSYLQLSEVSRARVQQRIGRAGRVRPGRALCLYTEQNYRARPEQDTPELLRFPLSGILLQLRAAGLDEQELRWLSAPPRSHWERALEELLQLGALTHNQLTPTGQRMLRFPLAPRFARILVEAEKLQIGREAARAVALLTEREIRRSHRTWGQRSALAASVELRDSDLEDRLQLYEEARAARFSPSILRQLDLEPHALRQVHASTEQLERLCQGHRSAPADPHALTRALLTGLWDRVAERRGRGADVVFMNGLSGRLSDQSGVTQARFLLALATDAPSGKHNELIVRLACRIDPDLLFDVHPELIETKEQFSFSSEKERVEEQSSLSYGRLTLDKSVSAARPSPAAAQVLCRASLQLGVHQFDPQDQLTTTRICLALYRKHFPEKLPSLSPNEQDDLRLAEESPQELLPRIVESACQACVSLAELRSLAWKDQVLALFSGEFINHFSRAFPEAATLPGGRRLTIHYEADRPPWIASRLQDFFSVTQTPRIAEGRLPLTIHLLAPNQRAVQVTSDLERFWSEHYPSLRKELMRRYPKHLWPEDGRNAAPPPPGRLRH